jgi:predicted thioredoxin/glutaredoxin
MPDVMIDTIRTIDDIFLRMVASRAIQDWVVLDLDLAPLDDVVEELWAMLARGDLRLVADGERLRVERFNGSEVERLRLARTHRPIIEARWRMLSGNPA